ncbi:hypothetical protein L6R52_20225, partial [Myxococcota bacterium]|nr:hypothetical protein [Myxococcota bacterium]
HHATHPHRAERLEPTRLRLTNEGRIVTALLMLGGAAMTGGFLFFAVRDGGFPMSIAAPALVWGCVLVALALRRTRSMGTFIVDGGARTLAREDGSESWSFSDVRTIATRVDWFARTPAAFTRGQPRWLVAELANGRTLRLLHGFADELAPMLSVLRELGLPTRR